MAIFNPGKSLSDYQINMQGYSNCEETNIYLKMK